jgi:hypothetical protein
MSNNKTAMQELIELLELNTTNKPLPYLIEVIKEVYLVKEKEQITRAYAQGVVNEISIYSTPNAEQYYNRTYEQ